MKLLIASSLAVVMLPIVIIALMTDLTWKRSAFLLALIGVVAIFAAFAGLDTLDSIAPWVAAGRHAMFVVVGLALSLAGAFIIARFNFRRKTLSLSWGNDLAQQQFDRLCFSYLNLKGWKIQKRDTVGIATVVFCRKDLIPKILFFVSDWINIDDLQKAVKRYRLKRPGKVIIVCYNKPSAYLQLAAERCGWAAVHYRNLSDKTVWE